MSAHAHSNDIHNNNHDKTGSKTSARILGSAFAGATELVLFHPVDTIAKRLMVERSKYIVYGSILTNVNQVIFKERADAGVLQKLGSLFPGIGYAMGYKILQRVYKFGGQPMAADALEKSAGGWYRDTFGEKKGKTLLQASAGSVIGVGEVVLLPLDVLKIKAQTNPNAIKGVNLFKIFLNEPASLWKGAGFTAARNAPGSFALFGGNSFMKNNVFHLKDGEKATWFQHLAGSTVGGCSSIIVAQPFDVIKTRIQKSNFDEKSINGISIARKLIAEEGVTAFFKGLAPKFATVAPKLIFSFTVAQSLMEYFQNVNLPI